MAKSKKAAKKKAVPKKKKALKRSASRSPSSTSGSSATPAPVTGTTGCTCVKFGQFYYCMVQKPDGSFERCPTQTRFKTLQQCQQSVCSG
jgi:hypothetical protein